MQKRAANHYFNFTRKERNGTIFLLLIIFSIISIPFIYPLFFKERIFAADHPGEELAALKIQQKDSFDGYRSKTYNEPAGHAYFQSQKMNNNEPGGHSYFQSQKRNNNTSAEHGMLFHFDPNTISAFEWEKLGVKEKTIATIKNYLSKGGKFKKPEDIRKIWGLQEELAERLLPFIDIKETAAPSFTTKQEFTSVKYEKKQALVTVDINESDTSAWIALPSIGSKLANRIVNFREKLGGFYSINQVAETFGLPDSVFQKIRPALKLDHKELKKLNINTATLEEMKQHPYIRFNLANLIIQYRNQHGNFTSVADIKKIMTVNEELYDRLSAYLSVQ